MKTAANAILSSPVSMGDAPLTAADTIDSAVFADIRRRLILDGCKWDPQVGDVSTVAAFPLIMLRHRWDELQELAEHLTVELLSAEQELIRRPDLYHRLAVPRPIRRALKEIDRLGATPSAVRAMRFDFHWTTDGWRISEVNSDVPGGFAEASELTRLICPQVPRATVPDDTGGRWVDALVEAADGSDIALLAAPGFMEDQQVVSYLARRLGERGFRTHLAQPTQIHWKDGCVQLVTDWHTGPLAAIVRFYQAEWLIHLPKTCAWQRFFSGSRTPVTNPGSAILTESKRFPLVWDHLETRMPTWQRLLPESRDPRDAPWRRDDGWLLKSAYCNTGDTVTVRDFITSRQWLAASWSVLLCPNQWVAQRRFEPVAFDSPVGPIYPCVGVYTINGRAAGAYTRISSRPVIDDRAIDAALLIQETQ